MEQKVVDKSTTDIRGLNEGLKEAILFQSL